MGYEFGYLGMTILLPVAAALLLYRFAPSKTVVKGPFQGLNIQLTGAVGVYFLSLLITVGLTTSAMKPLRDQIADLNVQNKYLQGQVASLNEQLRDLNEQYQSWTVDLEGIGLAGVSRDDFHNTLIRVVVEPPASAIYSNGTGRLNLIVKRGSDLPHLILTYTGEKSYGLRTIDLNRAPTLGETYQLNTDTSKNWIGVRGNFVLKGIDRPYEPMGAPPAHVTNTGGRT